MIYLFWFVVIAFVITMVIVNNKLWKKRDVTDIKNKDTPCVECGEKATKGSMTHPYCEKCFKELYNDDYGKYLKMLKKTHWRLG